MWIQHTVLLREFSQDKFCRHDSLTVAPRCGGSKLWLTSQATESRSDRDSAHTCQLEQGKRGRWFPLTAGVSWIGPYPDEFTQVKGNPFWSKVCRSSPPLLEICSSRLQEAWKTWWFIGISLNIWLSFWCGFMCLSETDCSSFVALTRLNPKTNSESLGWLVLLLGKLLWSFILQCLFDWPRLILVAPAKVLVQDSSSSEYTVKLSWWILVREPEHLWSGLCTAGAEPWRRCRPRHTSTTSCSTLLRSWPLSCVCRALLEWALTCLRRELGSV